MQQQVRILNRLLTWTINGIEYEADQCHADIIIKQLGLTASKPDDPVKQRYFQVIWNLEILVVKLYRVGLVFPVGQDFLHILRCGSSWECHYPRS